VPFLDHRLVEFSIGLGDRHKLVGGDTKRVLRRAMRGILPETVRKRRDKLGFTTPEEAWFRGPLREAVHAGVAETLDRFPGLFDPKVVWTLVAEMLDGRRNIDFSLWRIINLGIWGRLFAVSA
jgi:asparagine synthase (glutamine-hydrolysing)